MDTRCYMGQNSQEFTEWCRRNYGQKVKLRIDASWEECERQNTRFVVNGTEHPDTDFGTDIEIQSGSNVSIRLIGDSSAHVYTVDGVEVGYPITYDIPEFTVTEDKTVTVVFKQHMI